ncbi:HPr family phosphocarrier protein [Olsenella sp. Marseille-P4559]|uniref:HPr family phosphocarrier protein n=1 Tax=Olsenella sp. Marseille-P4559 TaxID=2364795 RepID=UPI00103033EE|nr:HPr family phosphocarrier protein [Olsenella sp. Marseille-P4559]
MVERHATVGLKTGLHARPATRFVQAARSFQSESWIARASGGRVADAKDVIAVLSLDIGLNDEVIIGADGPDEEEALIALAAALRD